VVVHTGHFRRGASVFLGKAPTLARPISRRSACNHLEIAAGDCHGWLWSVVAVPVVRACLTGIGIVRVLLRGASQDIGLAIENTAANIRPIIRETSRLPQSLLDRGWGNAKEWHEHSISRSATAFISAFSAKFGLRVILLSAVRVEVSLPHVRSSCSPG